MRRAFKMVRRVTFMSIATALGLLLVSSSVSADTCIFDPNESGAIGKQSASFMGGIYILELKDSDCEANTEATSWISEAGLNAFLGHVLAAKAMNKTLEVEYLDDPGRPLISLKIIEP